jgi:hypothetical protein
MDASTERHACPLAVRSLADLPDTPFALIYLFDDTGHAKCRAVSAESDGFTPAHATVDLDKGEAGAVFAALAKTPSAGMLVNAELFATPANGRRAIPRRAFAASILGGAGDSVAGFMIAGVNDDLGFDDSYRGFLEMAATSDGASRGRGSAAESESGRVRSRRWNEPGRLCSATPPTSCERRSRWCSGTWSRWWTRPSSLNRRGSRSRWLTEARC